MKLFFVYALIFLAVLTIGNAAAPTCAEALNKLQGGFGASIATNGASCNDFVKLFSPNATMASPSWTPYSGADGLYEGCLQFALPEPFRAKCTTGFSFVYTNIHDAINGDESWCTGTGVFTITLTSTTGASCMMSSTETDIIVSNTTDGLFNYVTTVYDYNGFGEQYIKCALQHCV